MIKTSKVASAGLDLDATLSELAGLALPYRGVWCILDVLDDDGIRRVPVVHPIAQHQELARELQNNWPPERDPPGAGIRVMRTRQSEIVSNVTDASLSDLAGSPHQLALLRDLRIGSVLTVPLVANDHVIGAMTFLAPRWGHAFDDTDRLLAEDVAAGAAMAIVAARRSAEHYRERAATVNAESDRASFMTSLSHTFRTPLHNIYGYAQLLGAGVRGPLNGDQRYAVQRIEANERHLLQLVNAVISFAKWEKAEAIEPEDIVVRAALERTNVSVMSAARLKGILYSVEIDSDDLVVRAEPRRLHEILLQLLLNAVKFSRAGDSISVSSRAVGNLVWIRVADTGIGITRAEQARIFRPFVRARDAYVSGQAGVGLGLAISQKLARAMGGEVSVTGAPGSGSTFTLALPRGRNQ